MENICFDVWKMQNITILELEEMTTHDSPWNDDDGDC